VPAGSVLLALGSEHPRELLDDLLLWQLPHLRARVRRSRPLDDREVPVGQRCDLREVGDADHLTLAGELAQPRANRTGGVTADPGVDLEKWTLTVSGLVQRPGDYKMDQIQAFPKVVQNTRHVCVEGWDVIGNFGGTRASDFLRWVGADPSARFLEVTCVDGYYESIDMATVLHPQTLFCYEMYGKPLDRGHGAPLRLQMPTKIGYKQAKYLDTIRVTNVLQGDRSGYWEDQGYSWYGGL